jgi:hypothetical protein
MSGIRLGVRHPTYLVLGVHGKMESERIDISPYAPGENLDADAKRYK